MILEVYRGMVYLITFIKYKHIHENKYINNKVDTLITLNIITNNTNQMVQETEGDEVCRFYLK